MDEGERVRADTAGGYMKALGDRLGQRTTHPCGGVTSRAACVRWFSRAWSVMFDLFSTRFILKHNVELSCEARGSEGPRGDSTR